MTTPNSRYEQRLAEAAREWRELDKAAKVAQTKERVAELERKEAERVMSEAYQRLYDLMADVAGEAGAQAVVQYGETLSKLADQ